MLMCAIIFLLLSSGFRDLPCKLSCAILMSCEVISGKVFTANMESHNFSSVGYQFSLINAFHRCYYTQHPYVYMHVQKWEIPLLLMSISMHHVASLSLSLPFPHFVLCSHNLLQLHTLPYACTMEYFNTLQNFNSFSTSSPS